MQTSSETIGTWRRGVALMGLLCGAALLACQPELTVTLASSEEKLPRPRFVIQDPERPGEPPRYTTVEVLRMDGQVVWRFRPAPGSEERSPATVTYGETPAGYVSVEGPAPLEAGTRYAFFAVGLKRGSLHFVADADGVVRTFKP